MLTEKLEANIENLFSRFTEDEVSLVIEGLILTYTNVYVEELSKEIVNPHNDLNSN